MQKGELHKENLTQLSNYKTKEASCFSDFHEKSCTHWICSDVSVVSFFILFFQNLIPGTAVPLSMSIQSMLSETGSVRHFKIWSYTHMWLHSGGSPNGNCNLETLHVLTKAGSFVLSQDERSGSRPRGRQLFLFEDCQALWLHPGIIHTYFFFSFFLYNIYKLTLLFSGWYGTRKL